MTRRFTLTIVFLMSILVNVASATTATEAKTVNRWYSESDVKAGQVIFSKHCANCHAPQAQGYFKNWKKTLPNGHYPAPPLNGTAHAWHHAMSTLHRTIINGGAPLGGTMPAFKGKLTKKEREQAIAYFQSFWLDDIYQTWISRGGLR